MEPTLRDADAWLDRADAHFLELRRVVADQSRHLAARIFPTMHRDEDDAIAYGIPDEDDVEPQIAVIVGEILQAFRRTLDYVAYQICWLDAGQIQRGTQFPIVHSREEFKHRRAQWLRGMNDAHVAAIETYQPYRFSRGWPRILGELSNADKHRTLTPLVAVTRSDPIGIVEDEEPFLLEGESLTFTFSGSGSFLRMRVQPDLLLENGDSLLFDLEWIQRGVRNLLSEFASCFTGACTHAASGTSS